MLQTIYGIDKEGYDSNKANNDHTVKRAIAKVLQFGVTEFNVFELNTNAATNTPSSTTTKSVAVQDRSIRRRYYTPQSITNESHHNITAVMSPSYHQYHLILFFVIFI